MRRIAEAAKPATPPEPAPEASAAGKSKPVPDVVPTLRAAKSPSPPRFALRTATVTHGDIEATVSASGTLLPEEVVDVSPKVAGQVVSLGDDPRGVTDPRYQGKPIDVESPVEKGTVLARLDDAIFKARLDQAKAACDRAKDELRRVEIGAPGVSMAGAPAAVRETEAALKVAEIQLDATVIRSPIKGIVLARRVNIGQNVAPDPKSPSLFLIAEDPEHLQIWAAVNEADVGRIHEGMEARCTVDALPKAVFKGKVSQVRPNAQMTQNVVLFTVVATVENANLKLRPYQTANVQLIVGTARNVLRVPAAALRWRPRPEQLAAGARRAKQARGRLWIKDEDGEHVLPVAAEIGLSDGTLVEVSGPEVKEGMEVIVGEGPVAPPAAPQPGPPAGEKLPPKAAPKPPAMPAAGKDKS